MTGPVGPVEVVSAETRRRLAVGGRFVVGAVVAGVVGGAIFLIMVQGSFRRGHTDLDFNHVLGTLVGGGGQETTSADEAFGVIGDSAGETGLFTTLALAVALVIVHGLVITRLVRRHWLVQGLVLGVFTFLMVGIVFCGIADAELDTPIGLFGADAAGTTTLVLAMSSLGFGIVAGRCFSLIDDARWWTPKHEGIETAIDRVAELEVERGSLELAEEGPEQRRMGP